MLYESGCFVVTSFAPPILWWPALKRSPRMGHLARHQQTKSQSKVEEFECKSVSFPHLVPHGS
jgi:hypothetical protein